MGSCKLRIQPQDTELYRVQGLYPWRILLVAAAVMGGPRPKTQNHSAESRCGDCFLSAQVPRAPGCRAGRGRLAAPPWIATSGCPALVGPREAGLAARCVAVHRDMWLVGAEPGSHLAGETWEGGGTGAVGNAVDCVAPRPGLMPVVPARPCARKQVDRAQQDLVDPGSLEALHVTQKIEATPTFATLCSRSGVSNVFSDPCVRCLRSMHGFRSSLQKYGSSTLKQICIISDVL